MHPTHLTSNRFNHLTLRRKERKTSWSWIRSTIKSRKRSEKLAASTAQAFAVNACAPGRYVLQVGANHSHVAQELKRKLCHVTAIAFDANEATSETKISAPAFSAAPRLPKNTAWFDEILLLDLIEQLPAPERFMEELRQKMARRGSEVVITTSNVISFFNRIILALSRLGRGRTAIPSSTGGRLFTFKSLSAMLEEAGYEIVEVCGIPAPFPQAFGENHWSRALLKVNQLLLSVSRHLFAYQICMRARPLPHRRPASRETSATETTLYPQAVGRVA
jgi:hypothetical protein